MLRNDYLMTSKGMISGLQKLKSGEVFGHTRVQTFSWENVGGRRSAPANISFVKKSISFSELSLKNICRYFLTHHCWGYKKKGDLVLRRGRIMLTFPRVRHFRGFKRTSSVNPSITWVVRSADAIYGCLGFFSE